jgi:hypothetical protein
MGRAGRAITLLGPADLPKWHEIERGLGRKLPRVTPQVEPVPGVNPRGALAMLRRPVQAEAASFLNLEPAYRAPSSPPVAPQPGASEDSRVAPSAAARPAPGVVDETRLPVLT